MTIEYTWKVQDVKYDTSDGGIIEIRWRCQGIDPATNNAGSLIGKTTHSPDPTDPSFIAYEDVTEENAVSWVKAVVDVAETEQGVAAQVQKKNADITSNGLPWDTEEEEEEEEELP